ncbi:hypothetical protein BGZ82_000859 [Podila clonocystis]|nr:hypothetical protein BGZ82_000859 [Podila clonocystis]
MNAAERTTASLLELYQEHSQQVTELQHLVQQQYPQQHPAHAAATTYLNDRITLFRFLKKANYDMPEAYNLVEANVAWRIIAECDQITPRDLEENPLWTQGLVQLRGQDRYGHPLITIRLGKYVPAPQLPLTDYSDEDVSTDEVDRFLEYKRYIIFVLECTRKMLWESSRRQPPEEHALQATLILDLQGASVSDLDHQLITYTIELLKHRYPSCIAQVYVLNYSWVFGGIWQMLKRALPESARARVSFPSSVDELQEYFDREELATEFGGLDTYQYDSDTCEAFHYFGYSSLSLQPGTPALSRVNSCDSIYFDAIQTPMHSPGLRPHEGLSFLSMTPMMPLAPPSGTNGGSGFLDPNRNPKNGKGNLFYRLILRPNSVFMRLAAKQANARQKVVKVVKTCADKMLRTDMKTLMYWVMALIMLRGEVWQLIAATAVKVLTVVGDGDELLL